ncbi:MAG: DNRLRE domain-containing protein, partial [Anaerolineae bacterium]|nr:DNRLRE domain-containing protein [Anaerolineae bacterium]
MDEPSYAQGTRQPRGYLTTPAELAEIRQKADQGLEPYASSVKDVLSYANQAWDFPLVSPVTCENADDPAWIDNTGGIPILYGKALAYHLTGDAAYAAEVKTILERIMTNIGSISLTELQCQLNFGWGTPELVASADLIEGYWNDMTCTGPTSTVYGQNQLGKGPCKELFQNWLVKNPYYIVSYPAEASGNNWGAAATNTLAYIADYLSDRPDVKLINRMPRELGGQDTAYSPAAAYARANTLAVERMNGYRVDYQSSLACDYLAGAQQLAHYTPVKSQITEKGIIPEDARREEYCNIPLYNGIYQNYPQIHLGNLIQQCELMRRRGDVSCFDNVDMTDLPNYTFLASDGTYKTTHLYAGRGSVERAINAVIIDAQTDWEHAPALQVAYRYYAVSGKLGYTAWWDEHFRAYAKCDQDICFGRLTHGFAADELLATPTPTAIFSPTPPVSPTNTPVYTATATALPPTNTLTSTPSATPTTPGTTGTLTITPSEDTLIKLAYPTSTYGERTYLRVREALPDDDIHTYLKFEVPVSVGTVVSAKLRLYAYDGSYDGGAVYSTANTYRDSDQAWTEDALNWNNAPALSDKPLSVAGAISANTWVEFDVSAAVMQGGVYSFAISNSVTNSVYFYAKEFASNLPQLVITTDAKLPTATHTPVYTATYTPTAVPTNTATN